MWTFTTLEDPAFETINGLWKGKTEPFVRAKVIRNTNFRNDGILDFSDVADLEVEARSLSKKRLFRGDIIIERSGGGPKQPVGRVCLFDINTKDNFSLSNFTTALRILDRKRFLPSFVCYYLLYLYRSGYTENLQRATTGIRNLDFSSYLKTEIPVPDLGEQMTISSILWKIQQAIEVEADLIRASQELKATAMKKLFSEGLNGELQKETEIGLVPVSWDVVELGEVARFQGGFAFKSADYVNDGLRLLRISNVSFGVPAWGEVAYLPPGYGTEYAEYLLAPGDIVMAMTRPVVSGGIKVVTLADEDAPTLLNQRVGRFRLTKRIHDRFLYQLVFSENFVGAINLYAEGSQQPNISAGQIERIKIPVPTTFKEQIEIAAKFDILDSSISIHTSKKLKLEELFSNLLLNLMSASICVTDLDIDTTCLESPGVAA
jgi:type I restriction enzyme S subunit